MTELSEGPFEDRVIFGLLVDRVPVDLLLVFVDTVTVLDKLGGSLFVDTATNGLLLDKV